MFIVEYRLADGKGWTRYGSGNTRRTAEVSESWCYGWLEDNGHTNYEVRIRKEK